MSFLCLPLPTITNTATTWRTWVCLDWFIDPIKNQNKSPTAKFPDAYPEHLPEVRVPKTEGDVWDVEAFRGPFGFWGVSCGASCSCASCAALYTHLTLGGLLCFSLWGREQIRGINKQMTYDGNFSEVKALLHFFWLFPVELINTKTTKQFDVIATKKNYQNCILN